MIQNPNGTVLFDFGHGLGDAVQFTLVLQHIRNHFPNLTVDVVSGVGKHSVFHGLCRKTLARDRDNVSQNYDQIINVSWPECYTIWPNLPGTKATKFVQESLNLKAEILPYQIDVRPESRANVDTYLATLPHQPFVLIHYEGNTSADYKNLSHGTARTLCKHLKAHGFTPVILDWDYRSKLPDQRTIFCPTRDDPIWNLVGCGDGNILAALVEKATLFIGIDSGPLHVAMATRTPTIGVWTKHHPLNYADISGNVTHLVPNFHRSLIRGNQELGMATFQAHYDHREYEILDHGLIELVNEKLGITDSQEESVNPYLDKSKAFDLHKANGLDLLHSGNWQNDYACWLVDALSLTCKTLLDVGCGCGAITQAIQTYGVQTFGIDFNDNLIARGKGRFSVTLNCCDAVNLHYFQNKAFDCIHLCEVIHEFRQDQAEMIFKEFHRVLKPGGIVFSLTTRRNDFFLDEIASTGFVDVTGQYLPGLQSHPLSKINQYEWVFQILRKST